MKRFQYIFMLSICILILAGCAQESEKGLSIIQHNYERTSIGLGRDIENSFVLCEKKMEKNFIILENKTNNTSRFQQVEEVTVPDEEQIKTYLNMTVSEIEKVTGNTLNEGESTIAFLFEDSYKGFYLDNSSFYFLCKEDEAIETPVFLAFYGKYHDIYLGTVGLSKDMNFKEIMNQWGEAEIEESGEGSAHHYRIRYERNGLVYSFVSDNEEGESFHTYIGSSDNLNPDIYDKYLHKIWMPQEWGENDYFNDTGFSISIYEIENNIVKAKISTNSLIDLPCFYYSFREYQYPLFWGTISGNTIEGNFSDKHGNKGKLRLILKDENEIEAVFEYENKNLDEELLALNGNYILRPYNLKDKRDVTINVSNRVNLNSWGNVYLAGGKLDTGKRIVGQAFLTDSEGNIFYEFGLPFRHGTEITDAYTKDVNGDGLMDVVLYEFFGDDNDTERIVFQRKDGLFYDEVLEESGY